MNHKNDQSNTAFLDLLFIMLCAFVVINTISNWLINPEQNKANIKSKAEYIITVTWDDESRDDVDTWIKDPTGNILFYQDKEVNLMHLDRDDLGTQNDTIFLADGTRVVYAHNQEIATIRGFISGEWVINIHMFKKRDKTPTHVEVHVQKINPTVKTVIFKRYVINTEWEEITVAKFIMARDGSILSFDDLPKGLVNEKVQRTNNSR